MLVSQETQSKRSQSLKGQAQQQTFHKNVISGHIWRPLSDVVLFTLLFMIGFAPFAVASLGIFYVLCCVLFYVWAEQGRLFADSKVSFETIKSFKSIQDNQLLIALSVFCLYLFINSLWAVGLGMALSKSTYVSCIVLAFFAFIAIAPKLPTTMMARHALFLLVAVAIGIVYLFFDIFNERILTRSALNLFPWLVDYHVKDAIGEMGNLKWLATSFLNKNVAALNLVLWPSLFIIANCFVGLRRVFLLAITYLCTALLTFYSESDTAKLALFLSTGTLGLCYLSWRFVRASLLVTWTLVIILTLPIMSLPYKTGFNKGEWLPYSARERVHIWDYTVQEAKKHFWLGIGVRSARFESQKFYQSSTVLECTEPLLKNEDPICRKPGWHPHNVFLEVWYELGLVGALLFLAVGVVIIQGLAKRPHHVRQFGLATFVMIVTVLSFGWGMWQSWLIGSVFTSVLVFTIAMQTYDRKNEKIS